MTNDGTRSHVSLIRNYINGKFVESSSTTLLDVLNPATGGCIARVPLSTDEELNAAVAAAKAAFPQWRRTPPLERSRYFFHLKTIFEDRFEEASRILATENGKTLAESRGSVRRAIENIEVAAGIPSLMQGESLEDVSAGIDTVAFRRPIGVFAAITPFNFPFMVPLWFLPYAIACGNTFVLKPSEQVPMSAAFVYEILDAIGLPPGVVNLVNGAKNIVDGICTHPDIAGVSFVGSSPVARHVYRLAGEHGKRVQALGGAKNFFVVTADCDLDFAAENILASGFGCAGERCLATSVLLVEEKIYGDLRAKLVEGAKKIVVGNGLDEKIVVGPVVSAKHKEKVLSYIEKGIEEKAELILDGRNVVVKGYEGGFYVGPTIFDKVTPDMTIAREEIFGPVLSMIRIKDLKEAFSIIDQHPLANTTSIFTNSGKSAREFQYNVDASMIGINIGVPAPMSFFSFGGAKKSFFGDRKAHGRESIDFYTDRKVIISRWKW
ncbi:MAG: CoA-acylating methylmalonate-semialdehyde dehydrogenase [bacterium]